MKKISIIIVFLLLLFSKELQAQDIKLQENQQKENVVGVVMSGGGAKGLAYIGMLQVLDSIGIPIQYIAGTSMGSIIGGLTAIGYSPDYLLDLAINQNWLHLLNNEVDDSYVPYIERKLRTNYFLTLPLDKKMKIDVPSGILIGQRVNDLFTRLYSPYYRITDFSKFPTPFLCIAVDLQTGKPVEMTEGYFPDALLASMSIPIALIPKEIDSTLFIDGGFVNNYPAENLKNRGIKTIIGFDVQRSLSEIDSINTILEVMRQFMDVNRYKSNVEGYKKTDILLHPDITGISLASFANSDEIINRGRKSVYDQLPRLTLISDSLKNLGYKPFKPLNTKPLDSIYIENFSFVGLHDVTPEYVMNQFQFVVPGYVKLDDIEKTLEILRASYSFKRVIYRLKPGFDGALLEFEFEEISMNTISIGAKYSKYRYVTVLLNSTFRNIGLPTAMLTIDAGIGLYPFIKGDYIFRRDKKLAPGVTAMFSLIPTMYYNPDSTDYKCTVINTGLEAYLKKDFYKSSTSLFLRYDGFYETSPVGNHDVLNSYSYLNAGLNYSFNSLDNPLFAKSGAYVDIDANFVISDFYKQFDQFAYTNFDFYISKSPFKSNIDVSFNSRLMGGFSFFSSMPQMYRFYLGGNENLVSTMNMVNYNGQQLMAKSGDDYLSFEETVQVEVYKNNYASFSLGVLTISDDLPNMFTPDSFDAYIGISYGIKTPIVPIKLSINRSLVDKVNTVFLSIGYFFE